MSVRVKGGFAWGGVFLLSAMIVWGLISNDLDNIEQMEVNYVRKLALLSRLESLPKEEDAIRQRLEQLNDAAAARYLYAGDQNSVQSLMQRDIRQLASQHDVSVGSMRTLGLSRQSGPLKRTAIQMNLVTTQQKLVAFLQKIESAEPILRVRRLSVRVRQQSTETAAAELAVVMEVTGNWRTPTAGATS